MVLLLEEIRGAGKGALGLMPSISGPRHPFFAGLVEKPL
jgi:hypothetical protein